MQNGYDRDGLLKMLRTHLDIPQPPMQVLLGPRQVGKTTAIRAFLKKWKGPTFYHTADQISPPDAFWIEKEWKAARQGISKENRGLLVFDEIQKVPRWREAVKKCYDEDRHADLPLRVVLLGSSSLLVQRGLSESLAGRFEIIPFSHWSYQECRTCFDIDLEDYLFYGGYPGALKILMDSDRNTARWGEYIRNALIETVLNKDILLLTPVSKPALFRQVFRLGLAHASEILSLHKMLGQLHEAGNASTIASYLRLLDSAMLIKPLEKYSGNRLRQKTSSPKLLVLNNALINAGMERTFKEVKKNKAVWGRLLENAIGASLVNNNMGRGVEICYWSDRAAEVDFVVRYADQVLAVEAKLGRIGEENSMRQFLKKFREAKCIRTAPGQGDIPTEQLIDMPVEKIFATVFG